MDRNAKTFFQELAQHGSLSLPLLAKEQDTHDSYIFSFGIEQEKVGGIVPSQLRIVEEVGGEQVGRSYTIISTQEDTTLRIAIKVYGKTDQFPQGGVLTQHLDSLSLGDKVHFGFKKLVKLEYQADGQFMLRDPSSQEVTTHRYTHVNMIVGGSGVTPAVQILQSMALHRQQGHSIPQVALIYANKTDQDIMLKELVEGLVHKVAGTITHLFSHMPQAQYGRTGFVSIELFRETLAGPGEDTLNLFCGPPPMNEAIVAHLTEIGHSPLSMKKF